LCRFTPGFEGAHVSFSGPSRNASALFIKFRTPDQALAAMDSINGAPFDIEVPGATLKAEFARREMEVRQAGTTLPAAPPPPNGYRVPARNVVPPPPQYRGFSEEPRKRPVERPPPPPQEHYRAAPPPPPQLSPAAAKRLRGGPELDTITILAVREKNLSQDYLHDWFSQRHGFVALHINDRINAVFAKFSSCSAAESALRAANANNFGAEWARRNLDL